MTLPSSVSRQTSVREAQFRRRIVSADFFRIAVFSANCKQHRPDCTAAESHEEVRFGRDVPEKRAAKRSKGNNHIADKVIGPERSRFCTGRCKFHYQSLPCGLTELFHPPDKKSNCECGKSLRIVQNYGKYGKKHKSLSICKSSSFA